MGSVSHRNRNAICSRRDVGHLAPLKAGCHTIQCHRHASLVIVVGPISILDLNLQAHPHTRISASKQQHTPFRPAPEETACPKGGRKPSLVTGRIKNKQPQGRTHLRKFCALFRNSNESTGGSPGQRGCTDATIKRLQTQATMTKNQSQLQGTQRNKRQDTQVSIHRQWKEDTVRGPEE